MRNRWASFIRSRKGAQTVEYIIILVAGALLAGLLYNFLSGGELQQTLKTKIEQIIAGDVSGGKAPEQGKTPEVKPHKPKIDMPQKAAEFEKKSFLDEVLDNPYVQEGTNFVLDSIPIIGNIKSGIEAASGKDMFGNELSATDRAIAGAGVVFPWAKHAKRVAKTVDNGIDIAKRTKRKGCTCPESKGKGKTDITPAASVKWKGFSKGSLKGHYEKHGKEFGDISQKEYLEKAKEFALESGSRFKETNVGNFVIKYDPHTRRVLVGHIKSREIRTFYRADNRDEDPFEAAIKLAEELSGG
ncbi:DUF4244 domain-containing protein [Kroppenstedtia eburnea]|uniref:DUF4244 domain-containing protein n=1 Tax=Kroppenstedtia eburnea TaxID=714067 RepID=UPI00362E4917